VCRGTSIWRVLRAGCRGRHAKRTSTDRRGFTRPRSIEGRLRGVRCSLVAIASQFKDPTEIEAARLTLASAILSVTDNSSRDVETLKHLGLQAMARKYVSVLPTPGDVKFLDEKHWRNKAEETRRLLATLDPDPIMRQGLLEVAQGYDRLAMMRERDSQMGTPR